MSHDGYELSRQEKIRQILKPYIMRSGKYPLLRVCYSQYREFSCGRCLKCIRTMLGLLLERIDPTKCGFPMDSEFLERVKKDLESGSIELDDDNLFFMRDIQSHIPNDLSYLPEHLRAFFEWFRSYDLNINYRVRKMPNNNVKIQLFKTLSKYPVLIKLGRNILWRLRSISNR